MNSAFEAAGKFGKYQKILTYLVLSVDAINAMQYLSYPFLTMRPEFFCREKYNVLQEYHPCNEEQLCQDKNFDYKINSIKSLNNIALEFNLYCERGFIVGAILTAFFLGGIFGSIFLSPIPDKKGRATIYKILLTCSFLLNLNMLFSFSVGHVILINFLAGFCYYCNSMATLIVPEFFPQNYSGTIMSLYCTIDPLCGIAISLFFTYINNWRLLFFIASIYSLVMAIIVNFYFLESPRWLNSQNRNPECLQVLSKIADINGRKQEFDMFLKMNVNFLKHEDNVKIETAYSIFEIIKLKSQRLNLICLCYLWFCSGFCYYGLIMNLEHLGGNIFLYSIAIFIGDIASTLSSGVLADYFGRIVILKLCGVLGVSSFILWEFITQDNWIKIVLIFLTSCGFSWSLYFGVYLLT